MNLTTILTTVISILALSVAIGTLYYSNRNNKKQILIGKYEELFEVVIKLGSYYQVFINLSIQVDILKNPHIIGRKMTTLNQYNEYRDQYLTENDKTQLSTYLARLEVLRKCYTKKILGDRCEEYNFIMLAFFAYTVTPASFDKKLYMKSEFPDLGEFREIMEGLQKEIVTQIEAL